jgi:hypothetical protein
MGGLLRTLRVLAMTHRLFSLNEDTTRSRDLLWLQDYQEGVSETCGDADDGGNIGIEDRA